ncbi:hypothetical protein HMPREF3146_17150 [Enterococcus sp. HMSC05C03]|uniref:Uncharacterized protein n=1 Tax=Enterococcus avium TaxID=33945 RepID=A0A8B5VUT7_ENTAV|nr:hypothetical protein HMPREF2742_21265 [Enterococcus sp. HMSC072H05]OFN69332.1 hypothetical protein HMPREF2539_02440 [Enterococcus sp. HMSC064A12]OFT70501.1 hypothetical protein HMPREF3146_17150 [Enterococcus sp. HMSC05C03]RGY39038.1 hypothetical protein DXA45_14760 [Enterococcus avium]TXV43654.1 hypothetical protein D4M89_17115 [Enterococcus sp. T0101B.F-10]
MRSTLRLKKWLKSKKKLRMIEIYLKLNIVYTVRYIPNETEKVNLAKLWKNQYSENEDWIVDRKK